MPRRDLADRSAQPGERLDLRRHVQAAARAGPVQRLDAERVAGQVHPVRRGVGQGERELAAQPGDRARAPFEEGLQHHLGVAVGAQPVAQAGELGLEHPVVEDLAVVAEHPPAVGRGEGLDRPLGVHDPQPLGAGQQPPGRQGLLHLAARGQRGEHLAEDLAVRARAEDERDAAHGVSSMPGAVAAVPSASRPAAAGLRHRCHVWPSSMALTSPACWRSASSPSSVAAAPNRRNQDISMSIAYPTQCALGRVAVYPSARSRRCCSMLRARLVTHSGGAPGAAAAKSAASRLSRVTACGRARAKRRPAVRGVRPGRSRRSTARTARSGRVRAWRR